jgi:hypothetical protein
MEKWKEKKMQKKIAVLIIYNLTFKITIENKS